MTVFARADMSAHRQSRTLNETTADFFYGTIDNPHTRRAYQQSVRRFLQWARTIEVIELTELRPRHMGGFVAHMKERYDVKTTKLTLAAVRAYFSYLVEHDVLASNPAREVKAPRHSYLEGKTPVITPEEERRILDAIPVCSNGKPDLVGLRDRALLATMMFTFARVGAVLKLDGKDILDDKGAKRLLLAEKNGKQHTVPCTASLLGYLGAYIAELKARGEYREDLPLFRAFVRGPHQVITDKRQSYQSAYAIVQKYARMAGVETHICNHTFRATGITTYLTNGGSLQCAQEIANHASMNTTRLYDRRKDKIHREELERVQI